MKRRKKVLLKTRIRVSDPQPITAAGGVVFRMEQDRTEVLLIRRNGVWDLPKGKLEEGESVPQCAVREVAEEVHAPLPCIVGSLPQSYHEYEEKGIRWGKTTHWYSMVFPEIPDQFIPQQNEGITDVKWTEIGEALHLVGYDNLIGTLLAFKNS